MKGNIMKDNQTHDENSLNKQEDYRGCYNTESLAARLNVSKKFIVSHRRNIPGAIKVGRVWRFDKATVERRFARGNLL
jgi:hypothetical protein